MTILWTLTPEPGGASSCDRAVPQTASTAMIPAKRYRDSIKNLLTWWHSSWIDARPEESLKCQLPPMHPPPILDCWTEILTLAARELAQNRRFSAPIRSSRAELGLLLN